MEIDFSDKIKNFFLNSSFAKRSGVKGDAQTPAKPEERKKGSAKNKKDSASSDKSSKIEFSEQVTKSLQTKVKEHNEKYQKKVSLTQLKKIYRRGAGAFSTSHRAGMTRGQWAMARVNMFLKMVRGGKVKDSYRKADQDVSNGSDSCCCENNEIVFDDFEEIELILAKLDVIRAGSGMEEEEEEEEEEEFTEVSDSEKKNLNKPFRLPSGSNKKFGVYVKNEKGNVVVVKFGDPNMEIKRDDPARRKNFRARHGCDNAGPKWKAKYWSCKMWSKKPVSEITGSSVEVDFLSEINFDELLTQEEILLICPSFSNAEESED